MFRTTILLSSLVLCSSLADADDLKREHVKHLPKGVKWYPYKHRRMVRAEFGRKPLKPGTTPFRQPGTFEDPYQHTPANALMFRAPGGGLTRIKNISVRKWSHIPGEVRRYQRRAVVPSQTRGHWTAEHYVYPIGTRFVETIAHKGRVFEVRSSRKVGQKEWSFDVKDVGDKKPPGYREVNSCIVCHRYAGKQDAEIPTIGRQSWWAYGRNIGDDFVLSYDVLQDGTMKRTRRGFRRRRR